MAKKYWWDDIENQTTTQNQNNTQKQSNQVQTNSEKKYWWDKVETDSGLQGYWWDNGSISYTVGNNVVNRVNNWLTKHNSFITDYQKRHEGRKYTYEDAYVSDSADWLNTVNKRKSESDAEYEGILSYIEQNKNYLDENWVKEIQDTLSKARDSQGQIVEGSARDNEYWSMFNPSEEQTAIGYTSDKIYEMWQADQKQYAEDEVFDVEAGMLELEQLKKERDEYLATKQAERKQAESDEPFWDSLGRWLGTTPDTTIPLAGVSSNNGSTNPAEGYDKKIAALEEKIERSKYVQGYEAFMNNIDADTYDTDSQYVSTRTDVAMDDARWGLTNNMYDESKLFGDFLYDYINRNQDALDVAMVNDTAMDAYFLGFDKGFLQSMSDEEIGVYNSLYAEDKKNGTNHANEFLSFIESDLEGRRRAQEQAYWAKVAHENPVSSSVFSTLISPLKGVSYLGQAADMLDDGKMDQNAGYNRFSYIPSSIRSQVSATIENSGKWGKVGSFAYNTGMSMADFLFTTAVSGGNQALSLGIMGSGAAADATLAAKDRGLDDGEAFALGTIAGIAEIAMERISLGAWLEGDMSEGALKYMLKNALTEGGEEAGTSVVNLLADIMIAGDKSEWNMAIQAYIEEGKTPEEAFGLVLAEQAAQIGLDTLGGILSGAAIGGGTYAGVSVASKFKYGSTAKNKASAQKLVAEGLELNPDNQYIQKMQGKLDKGKNLTGMQVRNILAANQEKITENDLKKIQKAAERRLIDLGQTKDVAEVAEIATKWATGQDLTSAEKKLLTHSEYGSRVANELLPENIVSGDYSTEWAENIGTKKINATAYNIKSIIDQIAKMDNPATYKSLEERVGEEEKLSVSKNGKATIRSTGEAIDLSKVEVADFITDKKTGKITDMTLKADGKEVKASEIDYADDNQSYLFSAVKNIENITPGDATAFIRDYDPSSGQTVGEYLNGIDEAFTYGYHKYSEADMGAGLFTPKLTSEQAKGAYLLGQTARGKIDTNKTEAIKRMRTAMEAEADKTTEKGKEAPKAKKMTITYNDGKGNVVDFDKAGVKLTTKQKAAPAIAKIMQEMGLGTNFELFSSYVNKDGVRMFRDENGVERKAYSGMYRMSDGTIRIDLNAYNGRGLTLNAMAHELTHFIQQWSTDKYNALADFLVKTYEKTDMSMHDRVVREQNRLESIRGEKVSYNEAYDEVVANAMSKMLDDGNVMERLNELMAVDMNLAQKLWEGFKKLLNKFFNVYKNESALFYDAADLMDLKAEFEQMQKMWADAFAEASENFQAAQTIGFEMDVESSSVSPAVLHSEQTWTESDYVQQRNKAAEEIAKAIGVSKKKAKDYIDSVNSIAKMIAEDRSRLDYFSSPGRSSFVDNAEYGGSFDFSTLCKKRRLLTGTFTAIQKALPNTALTANEILDIRNRMKEAGLEVSCGLCYVEGSRANMGQFAKEFLRLYKQYYPDAWQPNMADVNTPDGVEWVRLNHPECYEQYEYFWNHYGTLKPGDKNLFASQQKPKLYQLHTEYKGEILNKFKNDDKVEDKNLNGGIRLQSFSDFEIVHLIDTMQIIMDMSRVGLAGQAYTKVPDFAWALGDTGLKINLSLIAKGVDADGNLIFDDVEGMPIADAMKLRDRYSKNVGTILVAFNDEQLLAAMADDRVDFIIPFHRSQWKKSQYEAMGLPAKTKDYTFMQNEKFIKPTFHEYRGRMVKDKATNYMPNEYWDFSKSGKENAEAYLEMCARNNKRPKFYKLLQNNNDGSYSLKADGSTDGYWKLLIDFKMYDNEGTGSPQMPVKPDFNMEEATRMLNDYNGGHSNFPVAQGIVDGFVKDYKASHKGQQYSSQETDAGERFSMHDPMEETRDLLAFHNITEKLLWDALRQKGLVMPSLAVTNKGLNEFGEISLLFDKSVIDPALNKENKLYGADAWTPMQTSLKMNAKFDTNKTVNAVNTMKDHIGRKYVSELFNITPKQFKEAIIKADGNIYEAYAHDIGVQTAYAMEKGIISQIPTNKDGTVNKEMLQKQLDKTLDTDDGWRQYRRWLNNISDTVITSYDQATNEDILRHMKAQPSTAKTFKLSETGELIVPAREYSSIKEMRRNKNRLSENAEEATKAVAAEFMEFAKKIGDTQQVVEAINAGFEGRYNIADIVKAFRNKGIELSTKQAGELQALYKRAVELPTQYFEAKPGGTIGLDKVNTAVVPKNTSVELRQAMEEAGINVLEYDGTKKSRVETMNSVEGLRFSSQETDLDTETNYAYDGGKKKIAQEGKANVSREEVSHGVDAESSRRMGKENSGRESSDRAICERRIEEILREKTFNRGERSASGRGRVELRETREAFENRSHRDGLMYVELGNIAIACKVAPVASWNENAKAAAAKIAQYGFDVVVFTDEMLHNRNDITESSVDGLAAPYAGGVSIFISADLDIDGMETAYHEAFHAARQGSFKKYHEEIADIIASNVDIESKAFTEFISIIADLYAYTERKVSAGKFASQVIEEFYAWYVGKSYATENGDMQVYMAQFSNVESIKQQIDGVYAQMEADVDNAPHGLLMGDLFSSQETDNDFLAEGKLKGNYTVSEIGEMFDAWNRDADTAELAKKVFAKLQSIQDEYTNASWGKPYGIRFATNEKLEKAFYQAPLGVFKPERSSDYYGITYNLDRFNKIDNQQKANVLLHEAIHACTVNHIKSVESRIPKYIDVLNFKAGEDWSNESKAALTLIQIFEQVRTAESRTEYGQKDAYEMTAELANPEFRDLLKKQSLWNRVVDAIKRILGIGIDSKTNALDAASNALEKILELDMSKKANEVYSSQETDIDTEGMDENAKEIIHNLKIRAMDSRYRKGVYASYSEERIVRELNSSSARKMDYAKSYIAWVDPLDFLYATTTSEEGRAQIEKEAGELDLEKLRKQTQPIHLTVDFENGKIVGHEGRHRMIALHKAGVGKVAVIFDAWNDDRYNTKPVDMMKIGGQEFGRYHSGIDFYAHDMLPLSKRYADAAKKLFSEVNGSLRFSTQETDNISNRDLLANAFEGLSQNSDEYKMIQEYKGRIKLLNEYEDKLSKLNEEIRKMTFGTEGERDSKKLKELQTEAKKIATAINRNDKKLISMEASEPLRKVIEHERKKEAQKTRDHVKEIQKNKKARAEQTELRHKIRKAVRDLDKLLNRGNKKMNVKEDMKSFVSKALELADYIFTDHISNEELIRRGITVRMTAREEALVKETEEIISKLYDNADSLTDEEFTKLDAKRKSNLDKLRDLLTAQRNESLNTPVYNLFNDLVTEYASLKNSSQDSVKAAYNEDLENSLRAFISDDERIKILKNMRVADMTTEELNWLYRAYTMVLTNVRNANKFHVNGMNETIEQVVGQISVDFGSRKIPDKKLAIAMQKLVNKFGWNYEKLYYALDRIGSEAFTKLIMNIADSENTVMQDIMEAVAFRDEIVKQYGFNNWDVNKEIDREFLDHTGKKFKLTLGQLMSLYAYSRREGAWDHIEYGGFVFGEAALTNPKPADSYKLSKEQCEAITDLLTKDQKGYVEDMQKFLSETMGAKGNEVSMLLYGIKMFGEKNYFPIHIAGQFKAQANESQAKAAAGFQSMSNAGFTHAQNPNAKAPFVLEGFNEIWADHVNEMSRYHGTVPALEDLRRVMNRSTYSDSVAESQSVKQLMENYYGKEAVEYFDNLYREANSGAIQDRLQRVPKKLLSLFRKNSVAYSLSVVIQQPSAMARAYAMIDKKYFGFKGIGALTSGIAKAVSSKWNPAYANAYNEMLKYAPGVTLAKEIGGFDTHTGTSIREYLLDTNKSLKQKWKTGTVMEKGKAVLDLVDNNAIANLPTVADKIAWIEIWNACKRETMATHKNLAPKSEEFLQAVGDRFTEVIRATQVYDSMFSKSPMLKSKSLAVQYLVSFMNEPNTTANMVEKAVRDATKGDLKGGARIAGAVIYSIIFNNVLKSIVYAMRDDDEDETYIEKYLSAVASGVMADFNPLNYYPVVRDAWSIAQGYDVERPDMAIISDAIDAFQAKTKLKDKDIDGMTDEEIAELDKQIMDANWKLVGSIASFFGIPVKNIYREVKGVIDHARIASTNAGMTTGSSLWDKVTEEVLGSLALSSNESKTDKLYDAIIGGDKAYLDRLKNTYKDDDAYHTAVRKALRENDPRVKQAAQARYNGNTEEYKRIFREIQNEGNFAFDDIMSAINSELSKLTPDKVTSDYTASGYVEAIIMGNMSNAKLMKDDIIATKVANGKTQAEAEKEFASNVSTGIRDAFTSGLLDEAGAKKMLMEYAGKDEEEAGSKVSYWAFCAEHPEYDLSESNVKGYVEFAEPANIPLDVFAQYVEGTKGLADIKDEWGDVEVTKREQVLEVIDSLPLTWEQKDALYLAAGYSESKIWDVPW